MEALKTMSLADRKIVCAMIRISIQGVLEGIVVRCDVAVSEDAYLGVALLCRKLKATFADLREE